MARITLLEVSNADVTKEIALLTKQGKIDLASNKPIEWTSGHWKAGQ